MEKRIYMKPLLKSFLIESMDFLAASTNPEPSKPTKGSIRLDDDVTNGDDDSTNPWGDVNYVR